MIFVDTKRFSPVVHGNDVPHKYDLFHFSPEEIPKTKKELIEFYKDNNIIIDKEYWKKQLNRCLYGYTVNDAIDYGGDAIKDDVDCFWHDDDCYIPQYDILIRGRKVHISGRYYFYLNFWRIYGLDNENSVSKKIISPKFIDLDFFYAKRVEDMYKQYKDTQELKGRQQGYSEKVAGMNLAYNYTFLRSSVNIVVGGLQTDADHTMENCIRGLDLLRNTQFYQERRRGGDNNEKIVTKNGMTTIMSISAKDNPQALSRYSPTLVVYEEVGKGKKWWSIETSGYVKPSLYAHNNKKTGWQVFIGTGGEMNEGVADLEERFYNPKYYNILEYENKWSKFAVNSTDKVGHFTPKWWMKVIDENGNTLKEKGIKEIERVEALEKEDNKYLFKTQHPIFIEDVFLTSDTGYFGSTIVLALNNRYTEIKSNKALQIEKRGKLIPVNNKNLFEGVIFEPDNNGWITIIEEPKKDKDNKVYFNLYEAGTDSYDYDTVANEGGASKGAFYVKKKFLPGEALYNTWVAEIIERPTIEQGGAVTFYYHTVLACIYYRCQNNIEHSNLRIFDFYINNGFESLLKQRPKLAFAGYIKRSMVNNKYGTDKSLKPHGLAILKDRLTTEVISMMYLTNQIKALSKFIYDPTGKRYNCDITIATMESEISSKESESIVAKTEDEIKTKNSYKAFINVNGVIKGFWVNK